jgi:hypothetical protein
VGDPQLSEGVLVEIAWHANPMRGDRFERAWLPAAEAVLDYGATYWAFLRTHEGRLDFIQHAVFPTKADFERYWYSERIAEARIEVQGLYQVPLLPQFHQIVGAGIPARLTNGAAG